MTEGITTVEALREVNEQLVLSVIRAQGDFDSVKRQMESAIFATNRDALTRLPLRSLMLDRFAQAAAVAQRTGTRMAILFVDLDNFKQINDTLGHAVGDAVLQQTAERLIAAVRRGDTVSRHGGDEFVLLVTELLDQPGAAVTADQIAATLSVPVRIANHVVRLTGSIGISLFPDDGSDAATLIDKADEAMYRAKKRGIGHIAFVGDEPRTLVLNSTTKRIPFPAQVEALSSAAADHIRRNLALREANEHLLLTALGSQLLLDNAEGAARRQTEFMAVLAHELRNALAPMLNVSAMLSHVTPGDAALEKLEMLIERQVVHMARMVDDLLDVSRAETGKLQLTLVDVDITLVIAAAVEACQPTITLRLQHFMVTVPDAAVFVRGDAIRLTQILTNLIDNASKFTPSGGALSLNVTSAGTHLTITVSDSGIGITPEALPRVFELFAQDRKALTFNNSGLGIGLKVVQELVTAHGGTITAHSDGTGLGSQFVVSLPTIVSPGTVADQ